MDGKVIKELQDLRLLQWSRIRHSSGTAGSFLKARTTEKGTKWYYKLSDFDAFRGIVGHECVNEIIADRLLTLLEVPHVPYQLIHARISIDGQEYVTWLCRSADFKRKDESKIALDAFYQMEREPGESPLVFCRRQGWEQYIRQMLAVDFLILNRDRHGANMEVLRSRADRSYRLAPLFDHGLSLYFSVHEDEKLETEDPMRDRRVQCFVGSGSALENLRLIPKGERPFTGILTRNDRERLFEDLEEAISPARQEAVWDMLWRRWQYYESLRDS